MIMISLGYKGVAYASSITHGMSVIAIISYILVANPCPESLFLSFTSAKRGLIKYLKKVIPVAMPIFFDGCFYGIKTIIVGTF
jgi:Na+-driven multidrug efflux pump